MYTKRDDIGTMIGNETDEIFDFLILLYKDIKNIEQSMKGSAFIFDGVDLLYYKYHKIILNRGGSYINPPNWLQNKKVIINPKNIDGKCFRYSIALNPKQLKSHSEKISNIKLFIIKYNWEAINFPSHKNDWKKVEASNKTMAPNILYVP